MATENFKQVLDENELDEVTGGLHRRCGAPVGMPVGAPVNMPVGAPVNMPVGAPVNMPVGAPVNGVARGKMRNQMDPFFDRSDDFANGGR